MLKLVQEFKMDPNMRHGETSKTILEVLPEKFQERLYKANQENSDEEVKSSVIIPTKTPRLIQVKPRAETLKSKDDVRSTAAASYSH